MKHRGFILLTGASTGIGRVTALHLDQLGYTVFAGVRKATDATSLKEAGSERLTPILLDVTVDAQIDEAYQLIEKQCGEEGLLSLINNAGFNYNAVFEFTEETKARQMMETNFFGLYKMSQKFIPLLRKYAQSNQKSSKLINIGSIGSIVGLPWEAFYHASKFAVLGLTESLRYELKSQHIKATAILPGGIITDFIPKTDQGISEAIENLSEEGKKYYGKGLQKLKDLIKTANRIGSKPEKVARRIAKTIQSANPGFQYLVGNDAGIIYSIARILPISWRHALLGKQFL